jgi:hypothetical protein
MPGWGYNARGVSFTFGHDVIADFLAANNLDLICRAHQVVEDGYEFQADRKLVTIFSAPNYCGEFDNAGAMMVVDKSLKCSFKILRPTHHKPRILKQEAFQNSLRAGARPAGVGIGSDEDFAQFQGASSPPPHPRSLQNLSVDRDRDDDDDDYSDR